MANLIPVGDLNSPELAVYWRLTENQLKNRLDPEKGLFIAQTGKVISIALEKGWEPVSVLAEEEGLSQESRQVLEKIGEVPVYVSSREKLQKLTGFSLTRGILCAMRRKKPTDPREILKSSRRIAVLDGVVDATNVGAILRSAAALSMDGVILSSTCCDPLNRRAVRVSMGTVFQIPWAVADREGLLDLLHREGFRVCAMALREDTLSIDDPRLKEQEKLAILLGSEGWGLGEDQLSGCDYTVKIPMGHGVDSLNVAAASAVAFWQLGR